MDTNEFWARIYHERDVKATEGHIIQYNVNSRARGNPGGWEKTAYIVTVIFVNGDRTHIQFSEKDGGQQMIVETARLMVL